VTVLFGTVFLGVDADIHPPDKVPYTPEGWVISAKAVVEDRASAIEVVSRIFFMSHSLVLNFRHYHITQKCSSQVLSGCNYWLFHLMFLYRFQYKKSMNYQALRALLFKLPPEKAHGLTLKALSVSSALGLTHLLKQSPGQSCEVMGLNFPNRVGLAAGLDKNGDYIDALAGLGCGFIEIGTVTPKAQAGNPQPRLFRLPEAHAIINRMGFNNKGIDHLIHNVQRAKFKGILGINIGKNATTPMEKAQDDYLICLKKAYSYADYITINISSPNTSGLRHLQRGEFLTDLLGVLKQEQAILERAQHRHVPLVVKVAPDLTEGEVVELADAFVRFNIEGVIATNTTIDREGVASYKEGKEAGGLSGAPLTQKSLEVLKLFKRELKDKIPLIASGGIMTPEIALEKIQAGASLVQLYTGLIYQGPRLIQGCVRALNLNR
jgi:dihydroorotate dehydrogenase